MEALEGRSISFLDRIGMRLDHGYAPDVHTKYIIYEAPKKYTKILITQNINSILATYKGQRFKIGKTGDAEYRAHQVDYREAPFENMYLLYKHSNQGIIAEYEKYYIRKFKELFPRRCANIQMHSGGGMISVNAYYYLYLVI